MASPSKEKVSIFNIFLDLIKNLYLPSSIASLTSFFPVEILAIFFNLSDFQLLSKFLNLSFLLSLRLVLRL